MKKLSLLFLLSPLICHAEIMDKELSLFSIALIMLLGCIAAYFSARYKPWLLAIVLSVFGILAFGLLSEITDPFVGPAVAKEVGTLYILLSWANPLLIIILASYGLFMRRRNIRSGTELN